MTACRFKGAGLNKNKNIMPKRIWNIKLNKLLLELYPNTPNRVIAENLGLSWGAIKSRARVLGLKKAPDYKRGKHSKDAIPEETRLFIRDNYKKYTNHELAKKSGVSESTVQAVRREYALSKTNSGVFKKGHLSHNKGKTDHYFPGSDKGWFKKGHKPHNTKFDGAISLRRGSKKRNCPPYLWIRLANAEWLHYHRHLWIKANGPVPKGHIIVFKNKNTLDCRLGNLEMITLAENGMRNKDTSKGVSALIKYRQQHGHPATNLTDSYVAGLLSGGDKNIKNHILQYEPNMIELARANYKLNRLIKEHG